MRVLSASMGSLPESTHGSSGRHHPLCTMTSSPTLTFFTSLPVAHTMPEQSLPPARVEVLGLAQVLPLGDHVEGLAEGGPDVVVVDPGSHHVDEHLLGPDGGCRDDLALPGLAGLPEAVLPDEIGVHARGNVSQR